MKCSAYLFDTPQFSPDASGCCLPRWNDYYLPSATHCPGCVASEESYIDPGYLQIGTVLSVRVLLPDCHQASALLQCLCRVLHNRLKACFLNAFLVADSPGDTWIPTLLVLAAATSQDMARKRQWTAVPYPPQCKWSRLLDCAPCGALCPTLDRHALARPAGGEGQGRAMRDEAGRQRRRGLQPIREVFALLFLPSPSIRPFHRTFHQPWLPTCVFPSGSPHS